MAVVSATAADHVVAAARTAEDVCDGLQRLVSSEMAVGVVEQLEVVHVRDQDGERLTLLLGTGEAAVDVLVHPGVVVRGGKSIRGSHLAELPGLPAQLPLLALDSPSVLLSLLARTGELAVHAHRLETLFDDPKSIIAVEFRFIVDIPVTVEVDPDLILRLFLCSGHLAEDDQEVEAASLYIDYR